MRRPMAGGPLVAFAFLYTSAISAFDFVMFVLVMAGPFSVFRG